MSNKYNQFVQAQMKAQQPDTEKLIELGGLIRQNFELIIHREPILLFDKNDGHLVKTAFYLTEEEFKRYIIHVPDIMFYVGHTMWIFEIDGWIHNVKDRVIVKDERRNECYKTAKLNFRIFNEMEILLKQGKTPSKRPATADEVFQEVSKELNKITDTNNNK